MSHKVERIKSRNDDSRVIPITPELLASRDRHPSTDHLGKFATQGMAEVIAIHPAPLLRLTPRYEGMDPNANDADNGFY
jgi:hypothetical protein